MSRNRKRRSKKPPELPAPCEVCGPQGGLFVRTPNGQARCGCKRGQELLNIVDIEEGGYRPKRAPLRDNRKLAAGDRE